MGFAYAEDVSTVAAEYPDTLFINIDAGPSECLNVETINFREEQGSFLVGAAAALKTETGTVGMVAANDSELINRFYAGFQQGVAAADPEVELLYSALAPGDPFAATPTRRAVGSRPRPCTSRVRTSSTTRPAGPAAACSRPPRARATSPSASTPTSTSPPARSSRTSSSRPCSSAWTPACSSRCARSTRRGPSSPRAYDLSVDGVGYSTSGGFIDDIGPQLEEYKQQIIDGEIEVTPRTAVLIVTEAVPGGPAGTGAPPGPAGGGSGPPPDHLPSGRRPTTGRSADHQTGGLP